MNINYDEKYDILYIKLSDNKNSIGDEEDNGILILRDKISNIITGITIFDFYRKYSMNKLPNFPEEININIKNKIDIFVNKKEYHAFL